MEESTKDRSLRSSPQTSDTKAVDNENFDVAEEDNQLDKKDGESSPARCPICLAAPENRSKSESCSHYFCFGCLKEWSKVKAECPLCKMPFRTIFYNIKNDEEFDEYHVKPSRSEVSTSGFPGMMAANSFESWWRFRVREYRAQLHRRRENELAARQASSNIDAIRRRRMLYWNRTRVSDVDMGNRVRDVSVEFFRENPSQTHRLEPWLKRELTVLYGAHNRALISCVRDKIIAAVVGIGITSRSFINMLQPYLLEHTEQFVHEFLAFAKSPYDIHQYDRRALYASSRDSSQQCRRRSRGRERSLLRRNALYRSRRSRWDDSPDASENPGEPSSQSVMLSRTSWGDDMTPMFPIPVSRVPIPVAGGRPSQFSIAPEPVSVFSGGDFSPPPQEPFIQSVAISNPSYHYSALYPSRRFEMPSSSARDVEAPLVHQTIDVHRAAGSSARQYQRMEIMRQHMERRFEARRFRAQQRSVPTAHAQQEIIVISSDSSDAEVGTSSMMVNIGSKGDLNKPSTSQAIREKLVENADIKRERSDESTTVDSSDSLTESGDSDIEFVKYIKPPHLRTPDVFIDLSSTDDDVPGPSTRISSVTKVAKKFGSTSSSSSSSNSSGSDERRHRQQRSIKRSDPSDILQRTKEFLRKAKKTSGRVEEVHSDSEVEETVVHKPSRGEMSDTRATALDTEFIAKDMSDGKSNTQLKDVSVPSFLADNMTSAISSEVPAECGCTPAKVALQTNPQAEEPTPSCNKAIYPKKVFERGKVSLNFPKPRSGKYYNDSESDSDIDVGVEEVRPSVPCSWIPYPVDGKPCKDLPVDDESLKDQTLSGVHERSELGVCQNEPYHPGSRSSSHDQLSEGSRKHHEKSSYRSTHKRKKKHRHMDRQESRWRSPQESTYSEIHVSSQPSTHTSHGSNELATQYHYPDEKCSKKRHRSKKSHKKSKHRKRTKSSSVEFVSQVYRYHD